MTERLYYQDSFVKEFEAVVTSCEREGERYKVTLDRTAFYPTSGGQPHDLGKLAGVPVVEVVDAPDKHTVVHYTSAEVPAGKVRGEIDWERRLDHMQQHTAQHLLSAVFLETFGFRTVSFHLGREISTIDLETAVVTPEHLAEAEQRVNGLVFEDRVVKVEFGTAEELAAAGVRKTVEREGVLRAIEIEGIDLQPCGGTHLASTGQAGLILVRGLERRREGWRVAYVAGGRALGAAQGDFRALGAAAEILTCGRAEVPAVLAKTMEERRAQHALAKRMEEMLATYQAEALVGAGGAADGARVIAAVVEHDSAAYLALLAAKVTALGNVTAVLGGQGSGHVVVAQAKGGAKDLGAVLREAMAEMGGKGGGNRDFAQGSLKEAGMAGKFVELVKGKLGG